jgi:signal peptidase I
MTDSNQHGPARLSDAAPPQLHLEQRLRRNDRGRWIEGPPVESEPAIVADADPINPTSRFGQRWADQYEPKPDGHDAPGPPGGVSARPQPEPDAEPVDRLDPPSSRTINDTTFPLRRTEGEAMTGPSAPIRGPIGPGVDPGWRPDPAHNGARNEGGYEPIEESWSREWVERGGGDPSLGGRDVSRSAESGYGPDDVDDQLEDFGTDGRSFDEEELESGAAARRNAIEWAVVLVAATLLALVLRAVLLQAFYIPSPSMEDTLLIRDRVLVNKLSYRLHDINRGDVVVFHRTAAELELAGPDEPKDVIKRVIALPGETIEILDNQVLINGQLLLEPYLNESTAMPDFGPEVVPEDQIFVMGDNRNLSSDSRGELGTIETDRVVGRAFFLFWPLDRLSLL